MITYQLTLEQYRLVIDLSLRCGTRTVNEVMAKFNGVLDWKSKQEISVQFESEEDLTWFLLNL